MAFAPDVHVFPGGAVEAGDADPDLLVRSSLTPDQAAARLGGSLPDTNALAIHLAAIRELFEEAGVLLAEPSGPEPSVTELDTARAALLGGGAGFGDVCRLLHLRPRPDLLAPLSRWVTPRVVPRRFDAHFFAAQLPLRAEPSFAASEVVAHGWMTPRDALQARSNGELGLWVPTSATLQQLEHIRTFGDIESGLAPGRASSIRVIEEAPGLVRLILPSAGGVSGQPVNAYLVGRRELVIVDPGDPSEDVLDTLLAIASEHGGAIRAVAITHADPDHHGGAEAIAMTLEVPIYAGPGAAAVLPYQVIELGDRRRIPAGDIELSAIETPGHRADHISYVSADDRIIAGDLVGHGPARSILREPDLGAWGTSLDRLEAMSATRLFPGHGEPLADVTAAIADARARLVAHGSRGVFQS
jgi:endoribonuclease LACTB2